MGFNFKTKRLIYSAFKQFIDSEKSNEKYRKELIGNEHNIYKIYVSMENLFNSLKKNYNNGLDQEDICNFMETNGRKLCQYEIDLLMEKFDKNKDGLIDFDEFFSEISPKI
jgi:Ca2+-binding EF-hand superfamily protein